MSVFAQGFFLPRGLALDPLGNLFVADTRNNLIRKIDGNGVVTTILKNEWSVSLTRPHGIAWDGEGNLWVSDQNSVQRFSKSKSSESMVSSLLVGGTDAGNADGPAKNARFNLPQQLAVDKAGNVFVVDRNNGSIRKIDKTGTVSTIANNLGDPQGVALDASENLYVVSSTACLIYFGAASYELPVLSTQPASQTLLAGSTAFFSATATGTPPISYQWRKNGSPISGAKSSSFVVPGYSSHTILGSAELDTGTYDVVVSNPVGTITSNPAQLTVREPVSIAVQPAGDAINPGTSKTFSVRATGTAPIRYQWRKNGADVPGATSPSYSIPNVAQAHAGDYSVMVSNAVGSVESEVAVLTINGPAFIATQPVSRAVTAGSSAVFSVVATGTAPLSYQWFKNGTPIPGATSPVLAVDRAEAGAAYRVLVSNALAEVTSSDAVLTVNTPVSILEHPLGGVLSAGTDKTFSVSAVGTPPLLYQWHKNGSPIAGATGASYTIRNLLPADSGEYRVVVQNAANSMTSRDAALSVLRIPAIETHPANADVLSGSRTAFTVQVSGSPPLAFVWRKNGIPIEGGTQATLVLNAAGRDQEGAYDVVVSNAVGAVTSSSATLRVSVPSEQTEHMYTWFTFAGPPGGLGSTDGKGSAARFNAPYGITLDKNGNAYVADRWNQTIRKITPEGIVSTWAGQPGDSGSDDGPRQSARLLDPSALSVDAGGNVFVIDSVSIRKITPEGDVSTLAGLPGLSWIRDGTGSDARFQQPGAITVDASGNLYVTDCGVIRKIVPSTGAVSTVAGKAGALGFADGPAKDARFGLDLSGIVCDAAGNVFVTDETYGVIRKLSASGTVTTVAGSGWAWSQKITVDGTGAEARFGTPRGLALDPDGNLFVSEVYEHTIRKISPSGVVTTLAGKKAEAGFLDGRGANARFYQAAGLACDSTGTLLVADWANNTIRKITRGGDVSTLAGSAGSRYVGSTDGPAGAALFSDPTGLGVDKYDTVFLADTSNNRVRRMDTGGMVRAVNTATGALSVSSPQDVALDASGALYVSDPENNVILKVSAQGSLSTFAGLAGAGGSADGAASDARFQIPAGLAVNAQGDVFVADLGNSTIRKITPGGLVQTLAGVAGERGSTDGTGTEARFRDPTGIALDGQGNVFVADSGNHAIRKITPEGVVTTVAGSADAAGFADGWGAAARFESPTEVAVDRQGNLFVSDFSARVIRKILPGGYVLTIGGKAGSKGSADGTGSAAQFESPYGVALDSRGNVIVSDFEGRKIRIGVRFNNPPKIVEHPAASTATTGGDASLQVTAAGNDVSYQWRKNGVTLPGATSRILRWDAARPADSGLYDVIVRNPSGMVTSRPARLLVRDQSDAAILSELPYSVSVLPNSNNALRVAVAPRFAGGEYGVLNEAGVALQPGIGGLVPDSGLVDIPLRALPKSGLYKIRFTRPGDDLPETADSSFVRVELRSWEEVAGTYETLLVSDSGPGTQPYPEGDYCGFITFTVSRGGVLSGKLSYTEARILNDILGNPAPGFPRSYIPVSRSFTALFGQSSANTLVQRTSPRFMANGPASRQTLSLELDWESNPPAIRATVTDWISNGPEKPLRSHSLRTGRVLTAKSDALARAANRNALSGHYTLYAEESATSQRGEVPACIFLRILPSLRGIWTTRMPGYSGSGSGGVQTAEGAGAFLHLQEKRSVPQAGLFSSSALSGELVFAPATDTTPTVFFGPSPDANGLQHQASYLGRGVSLTGDPQYDPRFEEGKRWSWSRRLKILSSWVASGTADSTAFPPGNMPENGALVLNLEENASDSGSVFPVTFSWNLQLAPEGTYAMSPPLKSGTPRLQLQTTGSGGSLSGSYRLPVSGARRRMWGVILDPRISAPVFGKGWVEPLYPEPMQPAGAWSLEIRNP